MGAFDDVTDSSSSDGSGHEMASVLPTVRAGGRSSTASGMKKRGDGGSEADFGTGLPGDELVDPDAFETEDLAAAIEYYQKKQRDASLNRSCLFWAAWFALFMVVVFMARDVGTGYELESALKDILMEEEFEADDAHIRKTFRDIGEEGELWQWLNGPMLNAVGQQDAEEEAFILSHNRLLGSVRMRQTRVRRDACNITAVMLPFMKGCYASYDLSTKDTESYGPEGGTLPGFQYNETKSPAHIGVEFTTYDSGGYVVDLSYNALVARQQLQSLEENGWIDRQTKAVLVTVNVFNPNVNGFLSMTFIIEFTRAGLLLPSATFRSFRADLYLTEVDQTRRVLEAILGFTILIIDFLLIFSIGSYAARGKNILIWFTRPWWNFIQFMNSVLLTVGLYLYIKFIADLTEFMGKIESLNQDKDFSRMEDLGYTWTVTFNLFAGALFLSVFYFFKFLNVNFRMALLWRTLQRAGADLVSFLIFFFIIFLGFVATGHLIFGTELQSWKNFNNSFFTSFKLILGDFDYEELSEEGHRYLAPIWFISFVVLITFILMNMFLAILNAAWDDLQGELEEHATLGEALAKAVMKRWEDAQNFYKSARKNVTKPPKISGDFGKNLLDNLEIRGLAYDDEDEEDRPAVHTIDELAKRDNLNEHQVAHLRSVISGFRQREAERAAKAAANPEDIPVNFAHFIELMTSLDEMRLKMGLAPTAGSAAGVDGRSRGDTAAAGAAAGAAAAPDKSPSARRSRGAHSSRDSVAQPPAAAPAPSSGRRAPVGYDDETESDSDDASPPATSRRAAGRGAPVGFDDETESGSD